MPEIQQILLATVVPGLIAAVAGAVWRWPLRLHSQAGRLISSVAIISGFALGCWALEELAWNTERYGKHWVPYAASLAVFISLIDLAIPGKVGRVLQAILFLAFLPAAAWFLAADYPVHREWRWWIVGGLAIAMGLAWCAGEFAARRQKGIFPILLAPVLISTFAAVLTANNSLPIAQMCGAMVAVIAGAALFAGRQQQPIARPAAAFFAVALVGLLYGSYADGISAWKGTELARDVSFVLCVVSAWLVPLYVLFTRGDQGLTWGRGILATILIVAPAATGMIWLTAYLGAN